jgi:hypothetical protein
MEQEEQRLGEPAQVSRQQLARGELGLRHGEVGCGGIAVREAHDHPIIVLVGAVFDSDAGDHPPAVPKEPEFFGDTSVSRRHTEARCIR